MRKSGYWKIKQTTMNKKFRILIISLLFPFFLKAQYEDMKSWELSGYITNMQSVITNDINGLWTTDNLFHNRLNFIWYAKDWLTFDLQMRNRFMYGDQIKHNTPQTGYVKGLNNDNGIVDLTWNALAEQSFVLNLMLDRAYISINKGKWSISAGRQRINWAQTFAWNPNDLFNVYSFFDFDYPEKPGSDAVRIQRYTGMTSNVQVVAKIDHDKKVTAAAKWQFNKWNYDIQFLGGVLREDDYVAGAGWSGNFFGASFRGEMSYFYPIDDTDRDGLFMVATGFDYTFNNSLMLQTEFLYSQLPDDMNINNFQDFYSGPLTVKNLSFTKYNFFGGASYPITPLINTAVNAMYFPKIKGYAFVPNISYSLTQNMEMSTYMQVFSGEFPDSNGVTAQQKFIMLFLRLKANF